MRVFQLTTEDETGCSTNGRVQKQTIILQNQKNRAQLLEVKAWKSENETAIQGKMRRNETTKDTAG